MLCAHRAHIGTLVQVTRARAYVRVRAYWYEAARPASSRALLCYAQTSVIPAPFWHAYFHSVRMVAVNFKPWTFPPQASTRRDENFMAENSGLKCPLLVD